MALVLLYVRDDEPEIRGDQPLGGLLVTLLRAARETALFFGVGDQRKLLYVLQVLVECGGGGGTEVALGPALARCLHKPLGSDSLASAGLGGAPGNLLDAHVN